MNKAIDWDAYKGIDGFRRIREFEAYFPVGGVLGDIQFPPDFFDAYEKLYDGVDVEEEYFSTNWGGDRETLMLDSIFTPHYIWSQNNILSGGGHPSVTNVLPVNHIAIGSAYGDYGNPFLLINIDKKSLNYGRIFCWYIPGDLLARGPYPNGLGYIADNLQQFMDRLVLEKDLPE